MRNHLMLACTLMSEPNLHTRNTAQSFLDSTGTNEVDSKFAPLFPSEERLPPRIPGSADHSEKAAVRRRELLAAQGIETKSLACDADYVSPESLAGNIENFVGFARVPVGVIGPLRIRGAEAQGDFYIPMATTEGAMIASYHRGSQAISRAGGVTTFCSKEAVSRAPVFMFERLVDAGKFVAWVLSQYDRLQEVVATTSNYCKLIDLKTNVMGKDVYFGFEFTTGDASGQNMVTIATEAICRWLVEGSPVKPKTWFLEANASGDKKSSAQSLLHVRGKKVVADVVIDRKTVSRFLHTEPEMMVRYWELSAVGALHTGTLGVQGHYANALAGLFIATGQDVACVSEASIGTTRFDVTDNGDLYVASSMPNLIVGTVGGGTRFPTQRECLEMLDCYGAGKARKFAEICAATALAGEISIVAALSAGHFAQAHATYGRRKESNQDSVVIPKPHFPLSDMSGREDAHATNYPSEKN